MIVLIYDYIIFTKFQNFWRPISIFKNCESLNCTDVPGAGFSDFQGRIIFRVFDDETSRIDLWVMRYVL